MPGSRQTGGEDMFKFFDWRKETVEGLVMPSEAKKYWQYSQECTRQAVEAETAELRDQLLDLARMWTEAALCEEMNAANRPSPTSTWPQRSSKAA